MENNGIIDDLDRKESAFEAVKAAAEDVINKASRDDPAVRDIKGGFIACTKSVYPLFFSSRPNRSIKLTVIQQLPG